MTPSNPIPISKDASPVERWWLSVRGETFRQMPVEAALSLPIPGVTEGQLCLQVFYYGVKRMAGPGSAVATPPLARVTATYPAARLLGFTHRQVGTLFPGLPAQGDLSPLTAGRIPPLGLMRARRDLFALYGSIIEQYARYECDPEERCQFSQAFMQIAEPALLPYYRALNPDFFLWLDNDA